MKEFNEDYTDFDDNKNNKYYGKRNPTFFEKQEDLISPLNTDKKSIINNIDNEYLNSNNKTLSFIENNDLNTFNNIYNYNLLNNNNQCSRYILSDEQKKYLQVRDNTLVNKILDFFFNW